MLRSWFDLILPQAQRPVLLPQSRIHAAGITDLVARFVSPPDACRARVTVATLGPILRTIATVIICLRVFLISIDELLGTQLVPLL